VALLEVVVVETMEEGGEAELVGEKPRR